MPLDLTKFSPAAKARQIKLGKRFSSAETLSQANQTLSAYKKHGAHLKPFGFIQSDAIMLMEARDLLRLAGVDRGIAQSDKKTTSGTFAKALRQAQGARLRARTVLESAREILEGEGSATETQVASTLDLTIVASDEAEQLAVQLDLLAKILKHSDVTAIVEERGGPEALTALAAAAAALRTSDEESAQRRGTPDETQRLDQLDGIIVILSRRAARAARTAARELGDPALARAFKLDKLYKSRSNNNDDDDDPVLDDDDPVLDDDDPVLDDDDPADDDTPPDDDDPADDDTPPDTPSSSVP